MYLVYLDAGLLYSTNISSLEISDTKLTEELGKPGSFEFTIHPNHPFSGSIIEMYSTVSVFYDDDLIFWGRVLDVESDIENNRKVFCEGSLSFLYDSIIEPHEYNGTWYGYFRYLIGQHNAIMEVPKTFNAGTIYSSDKSYSVKENDYKTAWDLLNEHFCNDDLYLYVDHTADGAYINVNSTQVYNYSLQDIRLGVNLLDINIASHNEDLFTGIIPLGAKLEDSEERLTIASVNGQRVFLVNSTLANTYGRIFKVIIYDDITVASTLYTTAYNYLNSITDTPYTAEVTAVDLSYIDGSGHYLKLKDVVNVYSKLHFGVTPRQFMIKKIETNIQNPADNKIYAGIVRKGITDLIASGSRSSSVIQQEADQPFLIDRGSTGIWKWSIYSDGTAECLGKINVSGATTGSNIGSWYRSASLYSATSYPYPVNFSEAPATIFQFHTRNEKGALVWSFSTSAEEQRNYLPQCYLIRPTQADTINGNINILVKGKV